jgi:hypothetical protein
LLTLIASAYLLTLVDAAINIQLAYLVPLQSAT